MKELDSNKSWISSWDALNEHRNSIELYREFAKEGEQVDHEIQTHARQLFNELEELELKNMLRDEDDKRDAIETNDIPDIVARYENWDTESTRKRTDKSFLVPKEDIVAQAYDLSINRYKVVEYEVIQYDTPLEIINGKNGESGLRQLAEERLRILDELEIML